MSSFEKHLLVYENRSEYVTSPLTKEIFSEGPVSNETKKRTKNIKDKFEAGYIENVIVSVKNKSESINLDLIDPNTKNSLDTLVDSVTSEVGRALIGLTVMQLCIKSIEPEQNIRLHKGSPNKNSFSWVNGISMRVLDKQYVTPALRKFDLLKLNADGFMMTRSLAENYPYSKLYKAQLRGARDEWLSIVESLETGKTEPFNSLKYLISLLFNKAENFQKLSNEMMQLSEKYLFKPHNKSDIFHLIKSHIDESGYAARLMEISMHALVYAACNSGVFGLNTVKPLSQMRSANKKHGNIGDVEILENSDIIESWDAKYGKAYLRDEIDEVLEKIVHHPAVSIVGFVTTETPIKNNEIINKINEAKEAHGIEIKILKYEDWINYLFDKSIKSSLISEEELAKNWFQTYAEYLAQRKREIAPIDEPCVDWVIELISIINAQSAIK